MSSTHLNADSTLLKGEETKREINWKSFRIRMFSYSELDWCLNKKNRFRVFNQENFLWSDFLEFLSDLLMKTTDSMKVDQNSEAAKQVRKSLKKENSEKTINKAQNFIIISDAICTNII